MQLIHRSLSRNAPGAVSSKLRLHFKSSMGTCPESLWNNLMSLKGTFSAI